MGFLDNAQEVLDRGVSAAKGAVSGVAVEQQVFAKGFVRLCSDGWSQGWHESNGGNLTYRLKPEDVASCRSFFYDNPSSWVALGVESPQLAGEFFLVTAAGASLHDVALDLDAAAGIVELDARGAAWRIVWGFKNNTVPTSEFPSHVAVHAVRKEVTGGADRVLYHAHPSTIVALTCVVPLEARTFTRVLWKSLLESMIAFPQGVGVVPWMVPGGSEIAQATAAAMRTFGVCVWAHHGLLCAAPTFEAAFGLAQTAEKAASIYATARAMNGGSDAFGSTIPDEGLRGIANAYHLPVNEAFL